MPSQLVHCHHLGATFATFFNRKHHNADLTVFYYVLAPNVPAINKMLHRPFSEPVCVAQPFLRYPVQALVSCKLRKIVNEFYAAFSHPPTKFFSAISLNIRLADFSLCAMRMSRSSGFCL